MGKAVERGMRVLLSGSTGLIGRRVMEMLREDGAIAVPLVRGAAAGGGVLWDPERGALDPASVSGFDAVIHLAGEPVGPRRWTAEKKRKIYDSRVRGTQVLARALADAARPPSVFLCASGINFYGDRGDVILDESEPCGEGFLARVCRAWEGAAEPLRGVSRVASLRIGAVLSPDGGMLAELLPLFRLGLGGPIAGGRAYVSWVALNDLIGAVRHVLGSDGLEGAVNVVSPYPVTNREFSRALAAALHRPALIPVPGWAVRALFGQFGEETVLSSVRAIPARLLQDGFVFQQPAIGAALRDIVG